MFGVGRSYSSISVSSSHQREVTGYRISHVEKKPGGYVGGRGCPRSLERHKPNLSRGLTPRALNGEQRALQRCMEPDVKSQMGLTLCIMAWKVGYMLI